MGAGHAEHLRVPAAARARFASRADDRAARHAARPGSARFGQVAEALGDRIRADDEQVHHVAVIAAELSRVSST
ncbi:hypothetical protein ACIPJK_30670 [Streptomyces roseus]|uniref:hypothetical protein n=1 Tax=Streptomyces roseus TaxID=66430 RepID=UPI0037F5E069